MELQPTPAAREQFKALDKTIPFDGPEAIDVAVLECFPYEYHHTPYGQSMEIVTTTEEFTSVCPFSGLPDFAKVIVKYIPREKCIELRSLKYYLLSYRNVGIWYEHLVNRMLEDLVRASEPTALSVHIDCRPRGGLETSVVAAYDRSLMGPPETLFGK